MAEMGNRMDMGDEMVSTRLLLTVCSQKKAHMKTLRAEKQGCNETTACI